MINPFMVTLAVLQGIAAIYEFYKGDKYMAMLYVCYTLANLLLTIISLRIQNGSSN